MPFHVEARRPRRHARLFNLDEAELRRAIVEPWLAAGAVTIAERRWERRESTLRILEGRELSPAELAYGQGWNAAQRSARDVTAELLRDPGGAAVAVLAADPETLGELAARLLALGLTVRTWAEVRARLLAWIANPAAAAAIEVGAVVVACADDAPAEFLLDAGLALGALGPRAIVLHAPGGELDGALRALAPLAYPLDALAARLREIGVAPPPG